MLSEFLLVAAILVELKSQRLLPGPDEVDDDEELVGWEERDLLVARLLECRAYAAAADAFVALAEQARTSVPREVGLDDDFVVHAPDLLAGRDARPAGPGLPAGDRGAPAFPRSTSPTSRSTRSRSLRPSSELVSDAARPGHRLVPRAHRPGLTTRMEVIVHFLALLSCASWAG